MKQYICLNHGECNWADEIPPREFSLPNGEDHFCPNCESANVKEKSKTPRTLWPIIARVVGLVLLIAGLIWLFWPESPLPPLTLKAELNCQKGLITLTTNGGDGGPITYSAEGLNSAQDSNVFKIPKTKRNGSTLTFYAVQSGEKIDFKYKTDCPIPSPGPSGPSDGPGEGELPVTSVKWTRVAKSNFCDPGTCTLLYSETDNLGHTRERRIENYAECCPVNK